MLITVPVNNIYICSSMHGTKDHNGTYSIDAVA
jgi:hypothetical protein